MLKLDLLDKVREKENAGYQPHDTTPTFISVPKEKKIKKSPKNRILIIVTTVIVSLTLLLSSVYIPQFFIQEGKTNNSLITTPNKEALYLRENYLQENPDEDFDADGVSNATEIKNGSNPYKYDSDNDGVNDELDKTPTKFSNEVAESLALEGISPKSPYEMNGLLMWADNEESLIKGGAILLTNGNYRITNFKGWIAVPSGTFVYKVSNGSHEILKHKEKEDAWYINCDTEIEVTEKEPDYIHKFSMFGSTSYLNNNKFTVFLSNILPDEGWITSQKIWLDDTFIKNDNIIFSNNFNTPESFELSRFSHADYKLANLTMVYNTILEGDSVYASIINEEHGESIVRIIGFDNEGNLVAENLEATNANYIYIYPTAGKTLTKDNTVVTREWFEFTGCGYSSYTGSTISFFASSAEGEKYIPEYTEPIVVPDLPTPDETPTEPTFPENGEVVVGNVTVYYIDGVGVTDSFIRKNKGKYEFCTISDKGAFYVDESGLKKTGKFKIKGDTYYYNDRFFVGEFVQCGDTYSSGSQSSYNTIYVDNNGRQVFGWFSYGGNYLYASQNTGYIAHNCFVRNQQGNIRYVNSSGVIVVNKLIETDGIEIMIDENGSIINENYARNIINNNLVY